MNLAIQRRLADGLLPFAAAAVILLALVFGGGSLQGRWSDAVVQLASLPLLAFVLLNVNLMRVERGPLAFICFLISLPLLQLIPLPPALWAALPGREAEVQVYAATGQPLPWLPISQYPIMTWRSLLSLAPAVAVFLSLMCLSSTWRRNIVVLVLVFVFVSVLLDLAQMIQGTFSPLRFYESANLTRAVGFFANSNHNAALLYCAVPFAAVWGITYRDQPFRVFLVGLMLGAIAVGLAVSQSRAGLVLCVVAGLLCTGLVVRDASGKSRKRMMGVVIGAGVIALLIAFQFGYIDMTKRMQDADLISDLRWPVANVTLKAAEANLPFGSGFGTFVPVFQAREPQTLLTDRYMNRAHNDWLELSVEGGLLSITGLIVFLVWFVRASISVWRSRSGVDPLDAGLARAGSIVVLLLMLHSAVDYPLRTTGLAVLFAIACALLVQTSAESARSAHRSRINRSSSQ